MARRTPSSDAASNVVDLTSPDSLPQVTTAIASFLQGHEAALATEALGFELAPSVKDLLTQLLPRFAANLAANPALDVSAVVATISEGLALTPEFAAVKRNDEDDEYECVAVGDAMFERKRPRGSFATLAHDWEKGYNACKHAVHDLRDNDAARSAFVADAAIVRQRLASAVAIPDRVLCALRAEAAAALRVVVASKVKEVELAAALESLWQAKRAELHASPKVEVDLAVYHNEENVAAVDAMAAIATGSAATAAATTILDGIEVQVACYEVVAAVLHEICCLRHASLTATAATMEATYADAVAATRAQLQVDLPRLCASLLRFDAHVDAKMHAIDGYKADKLRKLDEICFEFPPFSDPEACARLRSKIKAKTAIAEDLAAHLEAAATTQQYLWANVKDVLGATECRRLLNTCRSHWEAMTPVLRDVFESIESKVIVEVRSDAVKAEASKMETVAPLAKPFWSCFW
ncbi:hypothetical protein SDRG_01239 [Saprolegnia diclina VS20]|uniref:Uncharacterized protein n=1 Tax=Saprolegnia diclina (strain VS20) TaxID=1156394 RepID=T0QSW2_SAPDV|nr:hypothetical protein SDRG_01239 [Saprolegnia diclina VS20]EQC41264.1 hypothetical protein SDRG_01239 [Saprolegnia diclina VS20]|eukprot:XP_008604978.1 hypothetical protein SDRG_01239 [Saprolegnia diclina VS20]